MRVAVDEAAWSLAGGGQVFIQLETATARLMTEPDKTTPDHEYWMQKALLLAESAGNQGEVPVGAVLVKDGEILGQGYNQPISGCDPTAHAEIVALRQAARLVGNYRLPGTTLYVTVEPCTMCVGALLHARVAMLVFGAREPRAGSVVSQLQLTDATHYNHRVEVVEGVCAEACGTLMTEFFQRKRRVT